jgi:hypothetical protein
MLETAVGNGAKKLGLQQEVTETSRVDTNVTALGGSACSGGGAICLLCVTVGSGGVSSGGGGLGGLKLLVRVVDEILLGRHVGGGGGWVECEEVGDGLRRVKATRIRVSCEVES